jgi:preprotein translocase subunit SecY
MSAMMGRGQPLYMGMYIGMIVFFAFFYTAIVFNPEETADNLKKNGGFIPGIRPGKPTGDYLNRLIIRITWGGAIFLGLIAVMPYFATLITDIKAIQLSSASLLIVVGVALDTLRQLESQLLMRNYEGFMN